MADREDLAGAIEAVFAPKLNRRPVDDGYDCCDCCGCSTLDQLLYDICAFIRGEDA